MREEILSQEFSFEFQQNFAFQTFECRKSFVDQIAQKIIDSHFHACLQAGITITSAENGRERNNFKFSIGPCSGIQACDDLIVARFLLKRIASDFGFSILTYEKNDIHVRISNKDIRHGDLKHVQDLVEKLNKIDLKNPQDASKSFQVPPIVTHTGRNIFKYRHDFYEQNPYKIVGKLINYFLN